MSMPSAKPIILVNSVICSAYLAFAMFLMDKGGQASVILPLLILPMVFIAIPDVCKRHTPFFLLVVGLGVGMKFLSYYPVIREFGFAGLTVLAWLALSVWVAVWARRNLLWGDALPHLHGRAA